MKSKKYPNLYKFSGSPYWVFRKYSKEKMAEFYCSTKECSDEAKAYRKGLEEFDKWLGSFLPSGRKVLFRDLARSVLRAKTGKKIATNRSSKNAIENHLIPAFGHLRPDQITPLRWQQFISDQRRVNKQFKFFNCRKALNEILTTAETEGLIRGAPDLVNPDASPSPPVYLDRERVRRILHAASPTVKLLAFIMWKQGARPGEVLQYRWDMIRWNDGSTGTIHIPGEITKTGRARSIPLNSRVARVLWKLESHSKSEWVFPSDRLSGPVKSYAKEWGRACTRAKVQAIIYNLRDTFITDRLMTGVSSTFVAKYVDSSTVMIDKMYAVAVKSAMQKVAG